MKSNDSDSYTRDLSQTEGWLRDILIKLLGWGWTAITLVGAWTVTGTGRYSLGECRSNGSDTPSCDAAVGLALVFSIAFLGWAIAVFWVRARCPEHATIPSRGVIALYICAMLVILVAIFGLVLD